MILAEILFTEYYHKYVTLEVDNLTDLLKENINVTERDCYALCVPYCGRDGLLEFAVLSIGPSWERCTKGLKKKKMLGIYTMDQVANCEARIADPSYAMLDKSLAFLDEMEDGWSEDILETRKDARLDEIRDVFYPDVVYTGVIMKNYIVEYRMRITAIKGPFLYGALDEEPENDIGIHFGDPMWALPYVAHDGMHLFALFAGDELSEDQKAVREKIIQEMNRFGIGFSGFSLRS